MSVTATIQELLQGIMDSQYGRDMRQFIHDAIQRCYEDGSAGELDLQARQDIQKIYEIFGNVETGTTASQAYAKDDTFIYDGKLYKAITAISQGDTFTEGTNIEEITVAGTSITPPDYSAIEQVWHQSGTFSMYEDIENDGWYALFIARSASYSGSAIQGEVFVPPFPTTDYTKEIAAVHVSGTGKAYASTQWMYFKAGDRLHFSGVAEDAYLKYCPCL